MRAQHTGHSIASFPVYSSSFLSDKELILGGGGGSSKSGVKNQLRLYKIGEKRSLDLVSKYEFAVGEDAPMSLAVNASDHTLVCGVNSAEDVVEKGQNENCRLFNIAENKFSLIRTLGTLTSVDDDLDFQKVTAFSPDGTLVAVAGSNSLDLLSYPSLTKVAALTTEQEIYDATFSRTKATLIVATTSHLLVYSLPSPSASPSSSPSKKKKKSKSHKPLPPPELLQSIAVPTSINDGKASFRVAKFHPQDDGVLYTALNTSPQRLKSSKIPSRHGMLCKWNTSEEKWTLEKTKKISDRGLTCFEVSPNGKLLGIGSSDMSLRLLDANTLSPVVTIFQAHEFPPTTLAFSPSTKYVVSGSADSVRIVSVPEGQAGLPWGTIILVIVALLVVLLAIVLQSR